MGSIVVVFFVIIILIIALVCVISNTRKIKYYGSLGYNIYHFKQRKKMWMIILLSPVICIGIVFVTSLIMRTIVIPIYDLVTEKPVYSASLEKIYWPTNEQRTRIGVKDDWFEMDGETYLDIRDRFGDEKFHITVTADMLGEPIATIQNNKRAENNGGFYTFMNIVLVGLLDMNQPIPVYPIINDNGFELYLIYSMSMNGIFCPYDQASEIVDFYTDYCSDYENYDMQNLICEYSAYVDEEEGKSSSGKSRQPYVKVKAEIFFEQGVFETLKQQKDTEKDFVRIEYPKNTDEEETAPVPGANINKLDSRLIRTLSNDGMSYMSINIGLYDGRVYHVDSTSGGMFTGFPVPDEYNQYLIDTVFVDLRDPVLDPEDILYMNR